MKIKKLLAVMLVLVLLATLAFVVVACDKKPTQDVEPEDDEPTKVDMIELQDPDDGVNHNKSIIYVTALFGGGLFTVAISGCLTVFVSELVLDYLIK